jgi:hypothetical protein
MNINFFTPLSLFVFATTLWASSDNATERYGERFVAYAQVNRTDGTYRRMLTTPDVLETVQNGLPLPDGTRVLMETYYSEGEISTVFHKQKVDGRWQYGSFNGDVDLSTRPQASCLSCHAQAAETDFTFTRSALESASQFGLSHFLCDKPGRSPCALEVYQRELTQ